MVLLTIPGVVARWPVTNRRTAKWLRGLHAKAVAGDAEAQHDFGVQQCGDDGCLPKNARAAFRWFERSWRGGYLLAANHLANAYMTGSGVKRDRRKAIRLLRQAIDAGDLAAVMNLGRAYVAGHGVRRDPKRGIALLRRAVRRGFHFAAWDLAAVYEDGIGTRRNLAAAKRYRRLAQADLRRR